MWPKHPLVLLLTIAPLAACVSDSSYDPGYTGYGWDTPFVEDDWIYYDEGDDDFLAGMNDEQREALKQRWDELSPEEKQQLRDRWNSLDDSQRARVREAWRGLDAGQRQEVLDNMETRLRSGQYRSVAPAQARPSPYSGGSLDRSGIGTRGGSFDRGSFGGSGSLGGRGGGALGGRGGGGFGGGGRR